MEEKKIATSVDVLINVGAYEHLQITKYAEKKITYDSQEEMIRKEDQLTDELVKDIIRTMRSMPDKLGKKTTAVASIEDKISKKIPAWLEDGVEPNIANTAQKVAIKSVADASAKVETAKEKEAVKTAETKSFLKTELVSPTPVEKTEEKEEELFDDDLFK
jgi:hypothetical protein